jgi:hypothetical protein
MATAQAAQAKAPSLATQAMAAPPQIQRAARAGFIPPLASLAAVPARPAVQRTCDACGEEEREEGIVQPRRRIGSAAAPPEPPADGAASKASAAVQRTCDACGEDEESKVQPRLEVGAAADPLEAEADAIAARVMAMETGAASEGPAAVQRACAACSSTRDERRLRRTGGGESASEEDEEEGVKARAEPGARGGETIRASDAQLTSGGSALPGATRSFFEARMGRDLSAVRIHEGSAALSLNRSISARAFTYRNHIWLGSGESASPSFTMAHELAHVMQQTAPGPLGPAAPAVQRRSCTLDDNLYFAPKGETDLTPSHNETQQWITGEDSNLLGEVPVPNANKYGFTSIRTGTSGMSGFADIVHAKPCNLVGMEFSNAPPPPLRPLAEPPQPGPQPHMWYEVPSPANPQQLLSPANLEIFKRKKFYRIGKAFDYSQTTQRMDDKAAPRWDRTDFRRDAATAPTEIKLGEVKHGGDRDRSGEAKTQLQNYAAGFESAAKSYERLRSQNEQAWRGSNFLIGRSRIEKLAPWSPSAQLLAGWAGKPGWQKVGDKRKLAVYRSAGNSFSPCDNSLERDGYNYAQHDPDKGYLWIYAFCPSQIDPVGTAATTATFRENAKTAISLQGELFASPAKPGKPAKRPLAGPVRARRVPSVNRDRRGLARAKTKPKPVPAEDPFAKNYESWKTRQLTLTGDFDKLGKTKKGEAAIGARLFDTAAANTAAITGKLPAEVKGKPPTQASQKDERKTFNAILMLSGSSGRFLGAVRKTFGGAFIRVVNLYQALRERFKTFMDTRKNGSFGSGSRLAKVAIKVGGMIFAAIIHQLLPMIAHLLIQCIERGFVASIEKLFGQDLQEAIGEQIEAIEAKIVAMEETVKTELEALIGKITADLTDRYEKLLAIWDTAKTLISVAKTAFNVARLAACGVTALETVGIGCVLAGADFVLSLFDVSPSEALAASLLNTCSAQKMIAEVILALDAIRNMPKSIADGIVKFVRPILPSVTVGSLKIDTAEMLCTSVDASNELPAVEDVTCGESLSDRGAPEGKDWRPPGEVDMTILNRKPTAAEIAKHGRLPVPGSVPARPAPKPNPPPTTDGDPNAPSTPSTPSTPGTGTDATGTHGLRDGDLSTGAGWTVHQVNVDYYIHGKGGGFALKSYDGAEFDVFITAVSSDAIFYGPEPIRVKVFRVFEDPENKGKHKIEFQPLAKKVLWFKSEELNSELPLTAERQPGRVGAPM